MGLSGWDPSALERTILPWPWPSTAEGSSVGWLVSWDCQCGGWTALWQGGRDLPLCLEGSPSPAKGQETPCTQRRVHAVPARGAGHPPGPGQVLVTAPVGPSHRREQSWGHGAGQPCEIAVRDEVHKWRNELYFQSSTGRVILI